MSKKGAKMDPEETVTISKEEYEELLADRKFVSALMAAGVDNWEGYEFVQEMMDD